MRARCGGGRAAWVAGVLAAPGTQGGWQLGKQEIRCSRRCQYWPTCSSILAWRNPLTEKPGRPQSTGSQRVGHDQSNPACIDARLFCLWQLCPRGLSVKAELLRGLRGPWRRPVCRDTDRLCRRSCGPIRVFFRASGSWHSEGLFGRSFSVALPVQALRGLPCLGSFSIVQCIRHMKGPP